jgi:hypothetical protein
MPTTAKVTSQTQVLQALTTIDRHTHTRITAKPEELLYTGYLIATESIDDHNGATDNLTHCPPPNSTRNLARWQGVLPNSQTLHTGPSPHDSAINSDRTRSRRTKCSV